MIRGSERVAVASALLHAGVMLLEATSQLSGAARPRCAAGRVCSLVIPRLAGPRSRLGTTETARMCARRLPPASDRRGTLLVLPSSSAAPEALAAAGRS